MGRPGIRSAVFGIVVGCLGLGRELVVAVVEAADASKDLGRTREPCVAVAGLESRALLVQGFAVGTVGMAAQHRARRD